MKLLWVKYGELLPLDTGGKLRSFHLLRQLAKRLDLTFLSYVPEGTSKKYDAALSAALPGSRVVRAGGLGKLSASAAWSSVSKGVPLTVSRFTAASVRDAISATVNAWHPDVVLCDFLAPTACIPTDIQVPTVLFEHNVEAQLWQRRAANATGINAPIYRWEHTALEAYERKMLQRFDLTFCVSEADKTQLQAMVPSARVEVLETGVDLDEFVPKQQVQRDADLVTFVGSMDWQPNVDGVLWFMREVWPQVIRQVPTAKFRVVGRRPPPVIQALVGAGAEITGDVDSVVPHFHASAVTVVPLRSGGGTRLKIYEAMAAGAPIVSTTIGAEGLPVVNGRDLILADEPSAIAREVVRLLQSPDAAMTLSRAASQTVQQHDWSAVAAGFEATLKGLSG